MRRTTLLPALLLILAACGSSESDAGTTGEPADSSLDDPVVTTVPGPATTSEQELFPVTVSAANGPVVIEARPERIVSLSSTATEMLFAVGAGDQVVAVDEFSDYPAEAPTTDLSGFEPNVEAVVAFEPDLVVVSDDLNEIVAALTAVQVPVIHHPAAVTLDDTYAQIEQLGAATGNLAEAASLVASMRSQIQELATSVPDQGASLTYYHELDGFYYTVTSETFIGEIYGLAGLENIADQAGGSETPYPQLSAEYIIEANPDLIFLADATCCGESPETVAARPGWDQISAVGAGGVVVLDEDVASRWGPRVVDFLRFVVEAIEERALAGS
jgi:iron complex transport system substrate-binding protein